MPSWKVVSGVTAVMFLGAVTLVGVGYAFTPIPDEPQDGVTDQGSAILYQDGKTPIVRLGATRESVPLSKVPKHVQQAVLAAEDRNFYNEQGVSPKGLARAVFKTAIGGDTQGGSTITQQLARNYYKGLSQDRTMSRKFKEIFISLKLGRKLQHEKILEMYLNTVYFGRQANGIQAASRAYFRQDVSKLNVAQGALLAAMIQQPTYFKTRGNDDANKALRFRWNYVLDGLVEMGQLSQSARQSQQFPKTTYKWSDAKETSQTGFIREQVMDELRQIKGLPPDIENGGLRVTTSLDPKWMKYAKDAMAESGVSRWPKNISGGLIAVDPKDGEIKAFYGGNPERSQVDTVFTPGAQVGSSFKPYVLATALKKGESIKSTIMGRSPQCFDGEGNNMPIGSNCYKVNNDEGDPPMGVINLVTATEKSVNTAYVKLGLKLGLHDVVETATELGIPKKTLAKHENQGGLSLGIANIPAVYQASGYAAFANGGRPVTPHLVTKVEVKADDGKMRKIALPWDEKKEPVLTKDQAAQATLAMKSVVRSGTGTKARLSDGRDVAGKTGTTERNAAAWFVGYVPQLSTAVTMYNQKGSRPISGIPGFQGNSIYGGTIPAQIWKSFMEKVIAGENMQPEPFDTPTYSDTAPKAWDTPPPTPTPSPSDTPSCEPNVPGSPPAPGAEPCPSGTPAPSPSVPSAPPSPGGGEPCDQWGMPMGCNPDVPPSSPPPSWWCLRHPENAQCQDPNQQRSSQPRSQRS
ncbi:transglycosylase domain-containing protein [Spirillospora sp. NPDC048911]|uniref:transglycosylase domain-containing protein n=1 Tax=Spirillospora sp. NPDC048911 TaxID=3364527 RepID=UPI00371D1895